MAVITKTLKSSGGDYSLMSTWESTEQTDLVSDGDTHVLECYEFTGGLVDNNVVLDGWTTGASNFVTIQAASGVEHGGLPEAGFYLESSTFGAIFSSNQTYTVIKDIGFYSTDYNNSTLFLLYGAYMETHNVVVASTNTSSGRKIYEHSGQSGQVANCFVEDQGGGNLQGLITRSDIYNTTVIGASTGISTDTAVIAKNNVSTATTSFSGTFDSGSTANASSDSSAPGSSPQTSVSSSDGVDFVSPSTDDYTPESGGKLDGNGTDLSGIFTDDITGATRSAWDIGAYAAAAGGAVTVSPDDVNQSQSIDNVTLTQANVLAVDDLSQGQSIDGATLTQANVLAVADIDQGQSLGNVTLTQAHVIVVNDLDQGQSLDNITLTSAGSLAVAGITQAQLIDAVALTQAHILAVDGIGQGQSIDNVTLAVAGSLAVQAVTQGQALDGVTLTQHGTISVDDLTQAQLLEAATLTQHYQLAVQDLLQNQLLDNVTLSAGSLSIAPDDLSQGQDIDQVSLTEYAVLAVNDLTQSQIIDIVSLGGLVIGELEGNLVVYALLDGDIVTKALLTGSITLH